MKNAFSVMLLAGMAGGAAWYRVDTVPPTAQASKSKIQIPDPGPAEELVGGDELPFPALDIELLEPVEKFPSHLVADREPRIHTISEEQPFAVSEEEVPDELERAVPPATDDLSTLDTEPPPATKRAPEPHAVEKPVVAKPATEPEARLSADGRPINVRRFGQGKYRTVIITGLDGRDRTAVRWSDELADVIEARPDLLQQQEFLIIRAANPDGLAAKTRQNSRNVDLNRNFPTKRYGSIAKEAAGSGPASEPETRAMLQTLYDFRPHRVVHLCSSSSNSIAFANQPAAEISERLQRKHAVPVERLNYDRMPGSLEEFAEATWNSSVVLLQLRGVPEQDVVRKLVPVMLATVLTSDVANTRAGQAAPISTPRGTNSRWQAGPRSSPVPTAAPSYQTERRTSPVLRRGYEELPAPPE